ncbi:SWIM zinc finger family protein [Streptomyces sp. NPDC014006]|uniref:SWIM zinc finger family protein n=1 Tax=Streptomyces sp. NPDC014006 TaxID=3364870 RepID=UPI0036FF5F31
MTPTDDAHGPGPAEAARRALREARGRGAAAAEGTGAGERRTPGHEDEAARPEHAPATDAVPPERAPATDAVPPEHGAVTDAVHPEHAAAADAGRPENTAATDAVQPSGGRQQPRPGDAAREALRRAVAQRRTAVPADDEAVEHPAPPDEQAAAAPAEPGPEADDAAPADRAREALRAARAEARRKAAEAEQTDRTSSPRRRPSRSAEPAATRHPSHPSGNPRAGQRARELRQLLTDAFRMPTDAITDEVAGETGGPGEQASRTTPPPVEPRPAHDDAPTRPAPPEAPAPAPRLPRSMAAPARDGDLRRTFPALAPRPAGEDSRFAETWWGNAWVTALEEGALDPKRLARGRDYAEQGHVDAITVTPGSVLAYVQGSRPRPYRVQVRLRTLGDADWARFLDAAAERPGHIAALLDKEMPHSLADCGIPLLPGPGDLEPRCSCPDRGHPCKHAAALCYQTARLLDADPFVLLLLRGRGERELLDALARLSATRAARAAQDREPAPLPGVRAAEALAPRQLPPLPAPLPLPPHPEQPPAYPAAPGGPDPIALDQLATDAAARAHALLATGRDDVGELTLWQDAVRLAAARPGSGLTAGSRALYSSLASAAGRTPAELARAVAAWRQGGPDGLAVLEEEPWDPPAGRFDRARPALLAADHPAFRPWRNRLTHPRGHVQLRLGRDGLWYAYESEPGADDWWPRGIPDLDPVGALTGLGTTDDV